MFVESQLILIFFFILLAVNLFQNKNYKILISLFLTFFFILEIISYYLTSELIDYRFFIHSDISSIKVYYFQFKKELILLLILFFLINFIFIKIKLNKFLNYKKTYFSLLFLIFLLILLPNKGAIQKMYEINKIYNKNLLYKVNNQDEKNSSQFAKFIKDNHLNNLKLKENLNSKKKYNIIYLILESIDSGFINGTPELTPNLNKLKKKWSFQKIQKIDGCNWSVGSLYCLMTGLPSYFRFAKNKIFHGSKEINIITLGDILKKSNYDFQEYYVGEANLVGTKNLLETMHFKVFDNTNFTGNYEVYPDTFGYHDKDLFFELKKRIKDLKSNNKSFAIFGATINTHLNGIKDNRMSKLIGNNYESDTEHAVKSLDYLIGDFINFLKKENLLENTAVFISPDHFFPNNKSLKNVYDKFDQNDRSLYLISNKKIISSGKKTQIELPKVILDTAEIEHNHKFFYEYNKIDNLEKFIDENKSNFSAFNSSILIYSKAPAEIKLIIDKKNFKILNDNNEIFKLELEDKSPSYINLIFDRNFIFKNDEFPKETKSPRKIRKEDEEFNYYFLTIFKSNNKIISAKIINAYDKSIIQLPIKNNLISFNIDEYKKSFKLKNYISDRNRFIAHAGGELMGYKYLNVLEALDENYSKGFRLFELDLLLTSDNYIVAAHDWKNWRKLSGYKGNLPPSLSSFNKYKILDKFTPLDYKKINDWFKKKNDAILVTDKIKNVDFIKKQIVIDQSKIFIETFSKENLVKFRKNGYKVIANIDFLKEIENPIDFLMNNDVQYISVSHKIKNNLNYNFLNYLKAFFKTSFEKKLIDNGFKLYAYNLNEKKDRITENDIACDYRYIFYGMYADEWNFNKSIDFCENRAN